MRSTPAFAASSKTRREPATFSSRGASLAVRIANARCTTTSAPFTRSRTLAASVTSPCRYRLFSQPRSAGSKGRRAIPSIRLTDRERSSALTMPMPRSPVGPVTATVRPSLAMGAVLPDDEGPRESSGGAEQALASGDEVEAVGLHRVPAPRPAVDPIALVVARPQHVVAGAGGDRVAAASPRHPVAGVAGADAILPGASIDLGDAARDGDDVVARAAQDRHVSFVRAHTVGSGAGLHVVRAEARVDPVAAGAAKELVAVGLPEESVGALAAEHQVLARACVDHVALVAAVDAVVAGAADHEIHTVAARHLVVAGAGLQIVVRGLPGDAIVASLAVDLVGVQCAEELVGCLGADQGVGHRDGSQQG